MKITTKNKGILWSVLEKYDGIKEYAKFCDALSNFIQDKESNSDILTVYSFLYSLDVSDKKKIDSTIGSKIDVCLFSI
jgi:hypothetical protein